MTEMLESRNSWAVCGTYSTICKKDDWQTHVNNLASE